MFHNIGKKIKGIAIFFFILMLAGSAVCGWLCYENCWFSEQDPGRLLSAAGTVLAGAVISFAFAALLSGFGQLISAAEDTADSNDEIIRRLKILTERVENLPVITLSSRYETARDADDKKEKEENEKAEHGEKRYESGRAWKCASCGNMNPCESETCISCGERGLWKCPRCGRVNPSSLDVCPGCRNRMEWKCRACGEKNGENDRRCVGCGRYRDDPVLKELDSDLPDTEAIG